LDSLVFLVDRVVLANPVRLAALAALLGLEWVRGPVALAVLEALLVLV
jgi:hypothetical protein